MTLPANTKPAARTIQQQTGWKRPFHAAICQDVDVLARVTEYSYDMGNSGFVAYFTARTGEIIDNQHPEIRRRKALGLLLTPVPPLSFYQQIATMTDAEYLTTDLNGQVIPRSERNLQDCWELYTAKNPQPAKPAGQINLF